MNHTTKTFPRRSMAEPWRGVIEHHRRPLAERVVGVICNLLTLAVLAGVGVILAWRG